MRKKYGIQLRGLGKALRPNVGVVRPKPTGRGGKPLKPKPIRPGKAMGGIALPEKERTKRSERKTEPKPAPKKRQIAPKLRDRKPRGYFKEGGKAKKFPDLTGDGKVTRADVLKGRGVFASGGKVKVKDKGAFETESKRQKQKRKKIIRRGADILRKINPLPLPKLKKKDN